MEARVAGTKTLDDESWARALAETRVPYRFSHRADAAAALERAYPEYKRQLLQVTYTDGSRILFPGVVLQRRIRALNTFLSMPLGWEGTPIPLEGRVGPGRVRGLFRSLRGVGGLVINGGAGGSPPPLGRTREQSTHVLDLQPGFERLWSKSFTGRHRTACRKAEQSGVAVRLVAAPLGAQLYHQLYARASRDWGYVEPPYPQSLVEALGASRHVEFWLGYVQETVVSGAVLLRGSEDVFYWSGAMDRAFAAASASNLVLTRAIEEACQRGDRYMDFGASQGLHGVQKFKEGFGAQPVSYHSVDLVTVGHRAAAALVALRRRWL